MINFLWTAWERSSGQWQKFPHSSVTTSSGQCDNCPLNSVKTFILTAWEISSKTVRELSSGPCENFPLDCVRTFPLVSSEQYENFPLDSVRSVYWTVWKMSTAWELSSGRCDNVTLELWELFLRKCLTFFLYSLKCSPLIKSRTLFTPYSHNTTGCQLSTKYFNCLRWPSLYSGDLYTVLHDDLAALQNHFGRWRIRTRDLTSSSALLMSHHIHAYLDKELKYKKRAKNS